MKSTSIGFLRTAFIAGMVCAGVGAGVGSPADSRIKKPSPQHVAEQATALLRQLAQLGEVVEPGARFEEGTFQVTCQCTPIVNPNGVVAIPVPKPTPPLDAAEIERAITFLLAINQMRIGEKNFEKATVTIEGLKAVKR